jgi:hypothetical protein
MDTSGKAAPENFLAQVSRLIDWNSLAPLIQAMADRIRDEVPVAAVKMLLLSRWYGLAETALLEACRDRLSFRKFLELPLEDDGVRDRRLAEIYRRQVAQAPVEAQNVIHAIEMQVLASGFSIRPGLSADASVVSVSGWAPNDPRPVSGGTTPADFQQLIETAFFQPGEMADLLKQGESVLVRGGARFASSTPAPRRPASTELVPLPETETPPLKVVLEWPWGFAMDLTDRLKIGRDHHFCMFASELQSYLHVSRKHAELEPCSEGVWVRDLKSRNGTFVNDEEIPKGQAYLVDTDAAVRFGPHCVLQLRMKRGLNPPTLMPA